MSRVFTVGHSTRTWAEFRELLREHGIEQLVDVRRFPGSRRHPHFARESLSRALSEAGIEYSHEPDLGGFRQPRPESPNTAWRSKGFRAYADHMDSPEFQEALSRLIGLASRSTVAIMCAEATPWRCHRQLISDALVARGHEVIHVLGPGKSDSHNLNVNARLLPDFRLVYREAATEQPGLFKDEREV